MRWVAMVATVSAFCAGVVVAAAELDSGTLVVKQGEASLTLADIDAYMNKVPPDRRPGMMNSPKRIQDLLTGLLAQRQLAVEARKLGLQDDPQLQREIAIATDEVLARGRMARFRNEIKVPDVEQLAQDRYAADKAKYVVPGELKVQHVLVSAKTRTDTEALARAQEVLGKAKVDGADFDALVEQYSDDPSKEKNHGIMPINDSLKYSEKFEATAKTLKQVGELGGPIKTNYGYHVLKLLKHEPDRQKPFAEVHDEIVQQLRNEFTDKLVQDHVDQVRNNKLDANPDAVASLRDRYMPAGVAASAESGESAAPAGDARQGSAPGAH